MDALGSGLVIRTLGLEAIIKKTPKDILSYASLQRVQLRALLFYIVAKKLGLFFLF